MSNPCEQKEAIHEIWDTVDVLKSTTVKMESSISTMVREFTSLSADIRTVLLDNRETTTRLEQTNKAVDTAFALLREEIKDREKSFQRMEDSMHKCRMDEIDPLWTWRDQMDGKMSMLKNVPILCTIITTVIGLFVFLDGN